MTDTPDEVQRAAGNLAGLARDLERFDPWGGTRSKSDASDLRLILSERAELLATVERMRAEMTGMETRLRRWEPRVSLDLSVACAITRAALTTGEEK